jgi:hypothetical protein
MGFFVNVNGSITVTPFIKYTNVATLNVYDSRVVPLC